MLSEVSSVNGTTSYQYDANGSLTIKENTGKFRYQYGYDLRNRLASANITRKEGLQDVTITSSYAYNTAGIRTRAEQTINGITQNRYFLLDDGHTGYSQVFEETSTLGGNVVRNYVLGDDVLSQTVNGVTSHLLYDGHGSTRQLAGVDGAITANYKYDAYGKMLGGDPNVTDNQSATDLLYAGEQFDAGLQMEYLRARYYDQSTGRFNRLDPFDGNSEDPQSLHKYAYAHCDPVNNVDPSGMMALAQVLTVQSMLTILIGSFAPTLITVYNAVQTQCTIWEVMVRAIETYGKSVALGVAIVVLIPLILAKSVVALVALGVANGAAGLTVGIVGVALAFVFVGLMIYGTYELWASDYPIWLKVSVTAILALAIISSLGKDGVKQLADRAKNFIKGNNSASEGSSRIYYGRKGGPEHQGKILKIEQHFIKKDWKTISGGSLREQRAYLDNGKYRYPDLVMESPSGQRVAFNVGRVDSKNNPIPREVSALNDLRECGDFVHAFFIKYP